MPNYEFATPTGRLLTSSHKSYSNQEGLAHKLALNFNKTSSGQHANTRNTVKTRVTSSSKQRKKDKKKQGKSKGPLKLLGLLLLLILVLFTGKELFPNSFAKNKLAEDDFTSPYIYVLNRTDHSVEFAKNSDTKIYPASLVKIMTTLVALEQIDDLSKVAPVDVPTYQDMVSRNASMAGFVGREPVTYRDLLYGTILSSGGEAANSLAVNISGDVASFVELMNAKAKELDLKSTHFTSPEGLHHKEQYTTAHDMAVLLDYALNNGHFRAIFTKKEFQTSATLDHPKGIRLRSTVLSRLNTKELNGFEVLGGKSGTTEEAGQCWATMGTKAGREYVVVVMGAPLNDLKNPSRAQIQDTLQLFEQITEPGH